MIRKLLLASIAAFTCLSAQAQFNYTFKDTATVYAPLTGGTSVNGSTVWDDDDFSAAMPFSWKMDTATLSSFPLSLWLPGVVQDPNSTTTLSAFMLGDADIADRGSLTNTASLSPIRYLVSGTTPNRIFKLEIANGGFWEEMNSYSTMNDSFNVQVWVYEGSNIVEYHFGPSKVSHPSAYFQFGGPGPVMGYLKNVDATGSTGQIYYLTGNAAAPGIDTLVFPSTSLPTAPISLWPSNGKVYRFTPKAICPAPATPSFTSSAPVGNTIQFTYSGTTTGIDSLVWSFGDGQRTKLSTGFTAPVSHTYSTAGHYTVTVTAYNSCGATTSAAQQSSVSVRNISALNIHVYPSPATDVLHLEGLGGKCTARIYSLSGKLIKEANLAAANAQLDISMLPAGSYLLRLVMEDGNSGALNFVKQ